MIKLTLIKSLIIESVKNETYKKGVFDKALDQKNTAAAYHEQAGDEVYQERMLARTLYSSLEELKTHFSDYITASPSSASDNIYSTEEDDNIFIFLEVSDRFNAAFAKSLAMLSSKYIEDSMLFLWWTPLNEKLASFYVQLVERDLAAIRRCFSKTSPVAPVYAYTTTLELTGNVIEMEPGEKHTVTYTISDGAVDDIQASVADMRIAEVGRSREGFTVRAKQRGVTTLTLFSEHDDEIYKTLELYVTCHD